MNLLLDFLKKIHKLYLCNLWASENQALENLAELLQQFSLITIRWILSGLKFKISTSIITEEDLGISHLSAEQRAELVVTINDVGLTAKPVLGNVTCVKHRIDVGDVHPIKQVPYRVPETKKQIMDEEVEKMLVKEVIRSSVSPWSSTIILVIKPGGSTRFCIDFRKVNSVTKKDAYPLPRIEETLNAFSGSQP